MKTLVLTMMIALGSAAFLTCGETDHRATVAAPTAAPAASPPAGEGRENAVGSRLRPNYRAGWGSMYPATLPPADPQTVSAVMRRIEPVLPGNWNVSADGNVITVARDGDVSFYNCVALDIKPPGFGDNLKETERLVRAYDYKGPYEIKLLLTRRISRAEYARLVNDNEPCLRRYREDMRLNKTMLEDFLAANRDCVYKEPPEYAGSSYSVFVTSSDPMGACPAPASVAEECSDVLRRVAKLFKPYDD